MPSICELIPEPEILIALDPEELGGVLLEVYAAAQGSGTLFSPNQAAVDAFNPPRYSDEYRWSVPLAMAEATQWLEAAGFIMQAPDQRASYILRIVDARAAQ
jgi:hypothetical protein